MCLFDAFRRTRKQELDRVTLAEAAVGVTLQEKKSARLDAMLRPSAFLASLLPELASGGSGGGGGGAEVSGS